MSWKRLHEAGKLRLEDFSSAAKQPRISQLNLLNSILQANKNSLFGKRFGFYKIHSYKDFSKKVPILNYQSYSPWVQQIKDGRLNALTTDFPFAFEETGGSSGGQKLIPYNTELLNSFQNSILAWLSDLQNTYPGIKNGKAYFAISPATRNPSKEAGVLPVGLPSDAAYFGEEHAADASNIMLGGIELSGIRDFDTWQNATLAWLLATKDLSLISIWSPTFLITLLNAVRGKEEMLLEAIHNGNFGLPPNKMRAKLVGDCITSATIDTKRIWPNLKVISTWADAGSSLFYSGLKELFPNVTFQPKGLLSTESIVTFPLCAAQFPLPALTSTFLEFEASDGQIFLVDELKENEIYQIIMTTPGGLYRYRNGDQIRCAGYYEEYKSSLAMLSFYGRGDNVLDMVGEKLEEGFIAHCLQGAGKFAGLCPIQSSQPHYALLLEKTNIELDQFVSSVEAKLFANPLYADARRNGQLGPIKTIEIEKAEARYIEWRLAKGHRMADIKLPVLINSKKIVDEIWPRID